MQHATTSPLGRITLGRLQHEVSDRCRRRIRSGRSGFDQDGPRATGASRGSLQVDRRCRPSKAGTPTFHPLQYSPRPDLVVTLVGRAPATHPLDDRSRAKLRRANQPARHCVRRPRPTRHFARSSGSFLQSSPKSCANDADNIGGEQGSSCSGSADPNDPRNEKTISGALLA
jgi:hypothetical protein